MAQVAQFACKDLIPGKTTLIKLLTLFSVPTDGKIMFNDIEATKYDPSVLRGNMSLLFQDFREYLLAQRLILEKYEGTVLSNIGLGGGEEVHDLDKVKTAAIQCGAHDTIRSLDSFYQTTLIAPFGDREDDLPHLSSSERPRLSLQYKERDSPIPFLIRYLTNSLDCQAKCRGKRILWGTKPKTNAVIDTTIPPHQPGHSAAESVGWTTLSGGQWQRVALARAFMKVKEADLLILDEPSSALDPKAEFEVFKTIMELRKRKTTIFIVVPREMRSHLVSPISYRPCCG